MTAGGWAERGIRYTLVEEVSNLSKRAGGYAAVCPKMKSDEKGAAEG